MKLINLGDKDNSSFYIDLDEIAAFREQTFDGVCGLEFITKSGKIICPQYNDNKMSFALRDSDVKRILEIKGELDGGTYIDWGES